MFIFRQLATLATSSVYGGKFSRAIWSAGGSCAAHHKMSPHPYVQGDAPRIILNMRVYTKLARGFVKSHVHKYTAV